VGRKFGRLGLGVVLALAGLVVEIAGAGPSSAATVSYSASAVQTNFQGFLFGISCPTSGSCVSVGDDDGGGTLLGAGALVDSFTSGTWHAESVATNLTYPVLNGVWCASTSSCVAVGDYGASNANSGQSFVETRSNGTWTTTTSGLSPSGAVASDLTSVTCLTISSCVAVGTYWDSSGDNHALFETLSGGSWTASTAADPSGATDVFDESIQCFSATSCLAVGSWGRNSTTSYPLLETLSGGIWTASTLGAQGDLLRSLSCPSAGSCMAIGYDNSGQGVAESLSSGTWTRTLIPIPSGTSMNGVVGVACPSDINDCVAIGSYREPANAADPDTLMETYSNGTWTPTTGIDSNGYGFPEGLSCPGLSSCVGVGQMTGLSGMNPMGVVGTVVPPPPPSPQPAPSSHGYWLVGSDGGIFTFGSAQFYGSTGSLHLQRPVVGIVPTKDDGGYWLDASDGGVFSYGDTQFYGSIPGLGIHPNGSGLPESLNAPIVGMVPSADDGGYFMVGSDGGVFAAAALGRRSP
jgi:hypothetical protein